MRTGPRNGGAEAGRGLNGLVTALWLGVAIIAGSTAASPSEAQARPQSPASAALQRFDRDHPKCQMWTDWRQLCSRTGAGGATFCRNDRTSPATPSQPFCVIGERDAPLSQAEIRSQDRFCARHGRLYRPGDDSEKPTGPMRCRQYRSGRPFSGERIEQMTHPACSAWGTGEPGRDICAEGGDSRLPSCASLRTRALRRADPFVCTAWREPKPCRRPVGGRSAAEPGENGIYVYDPRPLNGAPVWGTYCSPD